MFARLALIVTLITGSAVLGLPLRSVAQTCNQCGGHCEHCKLVPCTIMVPAIVAETRMKTCIIKEHVEREEKYTAFQKVPVIRKTYKEHCHLEDDVVTKTITQKKCHLTECPVYHPEMRDITTTNCNGVCETNRCEVMVPTQQPATKTWCEVKVAIETITKDIDYCVKVPKKEKILCGEEKTCEIVPVEQTRMVTVCVPKLIKVPEVVYVRKMIPQTIYCCPSCAKHHR
jgi:hypothetical protein